MDSNEKLIRFNKTEYDRTINRHGNAIAALQNQITAIEKNGLIFTTEDLNDVAKHGRKMYEQAEQVAKTEALRIHRIPASQDAFYFDTMTALNGIVSNFNNEIWRILLHGNRFGALDEEGFIIKNGIVQLSKEWKAQIRDRFTIYETPDREEALRLANNLKAAIDEINLWASKNPAFMAGFGIAGSGCRTLCSINGNWDFFINIEELENV